MNSTEKQVGVTPREVYVQILIEHNVNSAIKDPYAFLDEWALNDLLWGMSKDELITLHSQISNGYNLDKLVFYHLAEYIGKTSKEQPSKEKYSEMIIGDKTFVDVALECSSILSEHISKNLYNEFLQFFTCLYATFSDKQIEDLIQSYISNLQYKNIAISKDIPSRMGDARA